MEGSAHISPCGKYRYVLRRSLGSVLRWHKPILFIMLNPSTADAETDDPTIRRCMSFAQREGMTHLTVVNLFAFRATNPKALKECENPIGPENDQILEQEITAHREVVAAWGAHPFARFRAQEVTKKFGPFQCLGKTKGGDPRHPLYVPGTMPLEEYE